eukprot:1158969-Pelagomonas_calceolata.AAC.2
MRRSGVDACTGTAYLIAQEASACAPHRGWYKREGDVVGWLPAQGKAMGASAGMKENNFSYSMDAGYTCSHLKTRPKKYWLAWSQGAYTLRMRGGTPVNIKDSLKHMEPSGARAPNRKLFQDTRCTSANKCQQVWHATKESSHVTKEGTHVTKEGTHATKEGMHAKKEGTHAKKEGTHATKEGTLGEGQGRCTSLVSQAI